QVTRMATLPASMGIPPDLFYHAARALADVVGEVVKEHQRGEAEKARREWEAARIQAELARMPKDADHAQSKAFTQVADVFRSFSPGAKIAAADLGSAGLSHGIERKWYAGGHLSAFLRLTFKDVGNAARAVGLLGEFYR